MNRKKGEKVLSRGDGVGSTCHYVEGIVPASHHEGSFREEAQLCVSGQARKAGSTELLSSWLPCRQSFVSLLSREKGVHKRQRMQHHPELLQVFIILDFRKHVRVTKIAKLITPVQPSEQTKGSSGKMGRQESVPGESNGKGMGLAGKHQ